VDTEQEAIKNEAGLKSHFATSNAKCAAVADLTGVRLLQRL